MVGDPEKERAASSEEGEESMTLKEEPRSNRVIQKLLRLFVVRRAGLRGKWFHRVSIVLISASTVLLAYVAVVLVVHDTYWHRYSYAYSFEPGYREAIGVEIECVFHRFPGEGRSVYCGDIADTTEFLDRYMKGQGTLEQLSQLRERRGASDEVILVDLINEGGANNIETKRRTHVVWTKLLQELLLVSLIVLAWVLFWVSIVYRGAVYVLYRRKLTP